MVILAMDTSTDQLSLALGKDDGALIASWTSAVPKMHATLFHPVLDQMLAAVHINLQDLGAIVVGVGPGSYTGVRIAVTAAKVFAYTLNIPVVTVSSLEAAAYSARAHHGLVVVFPAPSSPFKHNTSPGLATSPPTRPNWRVASAFIIVRR